MALLLALDAGAGAPSRALCRSAMAGVIIQTDDFQH
jgi:hypothetical protein